jgi:dihydroxyacetone kinase-like protein
MTSLNVLDLRKMLGSAGRAVIAKEADLNSLDAAIGDGDHGITMRLGFQAIEKTLGELSPDAGLDEVFRKAGMSFMATTGGAIGVIFGKMLMACATPLRGAQHFGAREFRLMLQAMDSSVTNTGKVKVGDKTIFDAVHAAHQAVPDDAGALDFPSVVAQAAQAAQKAAKETAAMVCRVGRASRLGERSLGCPDPGATSFGIFLQAMADWLAQTETLA